MQIKSGALSALVLALSGSALAQESIFKLVLGSSDARYNGSYVSPCHLAATVEVLCPSGSAAIFGQNCTGDSTGGIESGRTPAPLQWYLDASPNGVYQSMSFSTDPSTNVAELILDNDVDRDIQPVAFDANGLMNIQSSLDDSVTPPNGNANRNLYSWFVCETFIYGFPRVTLNWILGGPNVKPHNPSCEPVSVKRIPATAP